MSIIKASCIKCEKPIEFMSLQDYPDAAIGDKSIPSMLNMTLDGTVVICGACKTCNRYSYDYKTETSEVVECNLG
jgi:hypothetical protein